MSTSPSDPPSRPQPFVSTSLDPYVAFHEGLVHIHHAILGSLYAIEVSSQSAHEIPVKQAQAAGAFLLAHHDVESAVLFPGLRRLGQLRTTDVAVLDKCDREHATLHEACEKLLHEANGPHPDMTELVKRARETIALLSAHTLEEESGLSPERMRTMISVEGFKEIGQEIERRLRRP